MKYFSTFTGIGGFELGIGAKHECVGYSEIDKHACAIYQQHFPTHKNYGDITKIDENTLPDFDLLVGGFPCQSFSIAGKRGGFSDTRGTLFFDLARILRAKQPRLFLFENVKGLLSHDGGKTFSTIIATLDELGYDTQWQVLNSKNHGVPQNRERVFIVGHLRGTRRPEVFPLGGSDEGSTQPDASSKEVLAGTLTARQFANGGGNFIEVGTLRTHKDGKGFRKMASGVSPTIPARAREDGSGQPVIRQRPRGKNKGADFTIAPTLTGKSYQDNNHVVTGGGETQGVRIREATKQGYAIAHEGDSINLSVMSSKTRRGRVGKGIAQTLDTGMQQYTIHPKMLTERRTEEAKRIRAEETARRGKDWSPRRGKELVPREDDKANALTANQSKEHYLAHGARIRRLTPVECERLQGFPDNWTAPASDTQRYKMCGNAVTVNVIRDIITKML